MTRKTTKKKKKEEEEAYSMTPHAKAFMKILGLEEAINHWTANDSFWKGFVLGFEAKHWEQP